MVSLLIECEERAKVKRIFLLETEILLKNINRL